MDGCLEISIWTLIQQQAQANPKRIAIVDQEVEITYEHLVASANRIASALVARGVMPGALVGVCMKRRWQLIAALLGVMRAGCAYVPLDPDYPEERVRYILEHSRAALAVVDHADQGALCASAPVLLQLADLPVEQAQDSADPGVTNPCMATPGANDLAYVIYTSGSTGRPKGVAVEHRSMVALSRVVRELLDDTELAGVLAAASVCFDVSVMELFGTLSLGGTVVLAKNVLALLELPAAHRVRTCVMVPSAMKLLLAAGPLPTTIRCVVLGGEMLTHALLRQIHAQLPTLRVVNAYGPTEDTVYSTAAEVHAEMDAITIGRSVTGSRAYILDDALKPLPVGVAGELFLAGDKLARAYLHDEALTQERFLELDANAVIPEPRLYRTGDLCRYTVTGEIEFLGRVDQQVKVRGHRVELEEIEAMLETMDGVDGAAAALVESATHQSVLVGYVVSRHKPVSRAEVRGHLAARLPNYMVPQVVMPLDALPLLPNGKLDRRQLPIPADAAFDQGTASAIGRDLSAHCDVASLHQLAQAERRAALLTIIQGEVASLLRLSDPAQVASDHSLYDLGIDSLASMELSARISAIINRELPVSAVLEHSTPAAVADFLLDVLAPGSQQNVVQPGEVRAANTLASFQVQLRSCYPPYLAAKAAAWSATDKAMLVRELQQLMRRPGDSFSKLVRTGSGHRGIVAAVDSDREREAIIWTTNLYLGLNRDPAVIAEARSALERLGTGMGTSAAASGITDLHLEFEREFAALVGKPAACLFPTGYTANLGAIAGLLGKNDVIVMDQLCHASIVDGARLCGATIRTFQHNNPDDLEAVLKTAASPYRTVLVVFEGVYSMGEGAAPVTELVHIAKKYKALVLVDEAHSFGFYGPKGAGICAACGVTEQVDFIMTTLSKALGSLGGVIAAREEHIALLKSSARAFIFQASSSPADIAAARAALARLSRDDSLRERLWDTTAYMRQRFSAAGYDLGTGDGPIVTPHFADKDKLYAIVNGLFERGVHTSAVTYPIVEAGRGRLRFICSASHTREDVDKTLAALIAAEREAEQDLQQARASGNALMPDRSRLETWAKKFTADLHQMLTVNPGMFPDLAISISLAGDPVPITIIIGEGAVSLGTSIPLGLPACTLLLSDEQAVVRLCSWDVQGLLDSTLKGGCELSGQVEPWIWLVGRLSERRRDLAA